MQPLMDLTRDMKKEAEAVELARESKHGKKPRKGYFKRFLRETHLGMKWTQECEEAFFKLKITITSEPVLRTPVYNGQPSRVTTDRCRKGFGGMVEQEFITTLEDGSVHRDWHPIAFCLKRMSRSEERYKLFLLEFAALKFALDKFADLTYGSPIIIVTDCRALQDLLVNDRLNATHSHWQQFILSHQIVDVGHHPGIENPVADGISRGFRDERIKGDGSEWSVEADWHERSGMTNGLWAVAGE